MNRFCRFLIVGSLAVSMLASCGKSDTSQEEVISKKIKIAENIPAENIEGQPAAPEPAAPASASPETATPAPALTAQEPQPRPAKPEPAPEPPVEEKAKKSITMDVKENASAPPVAEKKEPAQKKEVKKAAAAKKPVKKKAVVKAAPKIWAINVASFKGLKDAQDMTTSLKLAGYNAYITPFTKNGVGWHRVRIGFYRTRDDAEKAGAAVKKRFRIETPWVVKAAKAEASEHAK